MKTLAELREFATFTTQNESATDFERELAADYLRLTDPTPLTAEQSDSVVWRFKCHNCGYYKREIDINTFKNCPQCDRPAKRLE